jgi:hypothetical protein
VSSNTVTVAVASPGQDVCQSGNFTAAQLRSLSSGGTLTLGSFTLSKSATSMSAMGLTLDQSTEAITGDFAKYGLGNVSSYGSTANVSVNTVGSCTVVRVTGTTDAILYSAPPATLLDAGASLRLAGPNNVNISIPRGPTTTNTTKNYYSYTQSVISGLPISIPGLGGGTSFISAGTFTLSGTGGADVGSFSTSLDVPQPVVWTNKDSITTVPRSQNLNITWTGGGSNDLYIVGASGNQAGGTQTNPVYDMTTFVCLTKANLLNFSVPSAVLSQLPATSGNGVGLLALQLNGKATFTAPLTAGGNIDSGVFLFSTGASKVPLTYQ